MENPSALICLVAVAGRHGIMTTVPRLLHDFALPKGEPTTPVLLRISETIGLKAKSTHMNGAELIALTGVFPLLARMNNGHTVVVAGMRLDANHRQVAVFDPSSNQPGLFLVALEGFLASWSGEIILLKRPYALTDETQPFGLRWFVPELLRQSRVLLHVAVAAITLLLLGLAAPIYFQLVIDKVLVHQSLSTLQVLTAGIVLAILFEAIFGFLRQFLLLTATNKIDIRLATRTFAHLLRLPIDYFETVSAGVTVQHLQQVEKIRQFLTGSLLLTLLDATALFVFLPVLLLYSVKLTLVVLLFTATIALVIWAMLGPFRHRLRDLYHAEAQRQAMLVETIQGMRTVKSSAMEPVKGRDWDRKAARSVLMHYQVGKIAITANALVQFLEKLLGVAIIAIGAGDVFSHTLTVGSLVAFQMLSGRVVTPLVAIVHLIQSYQETALSVQMLATVMNHPVERDAQTIGVAPPLKGRIEFEHVTFRYPNQSEPVLYDLSLVIPAGGILGVVGRSGSGKTTLTRLIQGLYPLQEGIIRLDATDLREIDLVHLRRSIGVVLQDNFLFRGTVRENIAATRPDASLEEIAASAHLAGAVEFIERLPQGYETLLEENAANLSGGQRQRLAIARALLANPRILIFDEATSALDPESEAIIMANLRSISAGRTVILVSHRLSTLAPCHAILVMDRGRILAGGPHRELLAGCELYRKLWEIQHQNQ